MSDYMTEDEQVEALKRWWKENGNAIIIGIVVGLGAVIGVRYWFSYNETRALKASDAYNSFIAAETGNDKADTQKLTKILLDKYKGTSYAALTALRLAKQDVNDNKLSDAEKNLRWAVKHPGYKAIGLTARKRLAIVLMGENKLNQALAVLDKVRDPTYDSSFALVRADILRKQGKIEQAREAYQLALTSPSLTGKERDFVQMKMDNLTVTASATAKGDKTKK